MRNKLAVSELPAHGPEISKLADTALRRAGARGVLPTPIDNLIGATSIRDHSDSGDYLSNLLDKLNVSAKETFKGILNKIRGITDYRETAIYIPSDTKPRERFAKGHELGHHDMPWHRVHGKDGYLHDDNYTLGHEVKEIFEQEANFYSAEIIFQGASFINRARSFRPSIDAIRHLAGQHGASVHATLRKYAEVQDESIATIAYLQSKIKTYPGTELPILNAPRICGSPNFLRKYRNIRLPFELGIDHPWVSARGSIEIPEGHIDLNCGSEEICFWWQAWWNNYSLLVLLRREPRFRLIGKILS